MPELTEDYLWEENVAGDKQRQGRGQVGVLAEERWEEEIFKMGVLVWHLTQ